MAKTRPPLTVIFLGDSLTQGVGDETGLGWVGRLATRINETRELTWYNLGIRGNTTLELSRRAADEVRSRILPGSQEEMWIVICIGTNDASLIESVPRVPHERSLQLIERTLDALVPLGKVLWISPVPLTDEKHQFQHEGMTFTFQTERIRALNEGFSSVAERRGIPYLDLVNEAAGLNFVAHETSDGVHPKSPGYRALFDMIVRWKSLEPALTSSET